MHNESCIFCRIVSNETNATIVYRDQLVIAFRDLHPAAPTHILIIPIKHIPSLNELQAGDERVLANLFLVGRKLVLQEALEKSGYRLVLNTGDDGGQTVYHLHLHLLGGRRMHWPPG